VRAHCEPPPVIVSKPQAPSTELPPEEAILFDQIGSASRSGRSSQPVIHGSQNRSTDTSITGGNLYQTGTENARNPVDPDLGQYGHANAGTRGNVGIVESASCRF
jgi:hypothetical protein